MTHSDGGAKAHSSKYRPDVDGLRALAILPVLLFHASLGCPGGFVGVDVFFVISGYLISSLILKELGDGTFSLITFWERRIRRILPALTAVVLATLVAGWFLFLPDDFASVGKSVVAQATLLSNYFFYRQAGYFEAGSETKPLLHTWSLAVEEQFYLLFPLLLIFLARSRWLSLSKATACLAAVSFALSIIGSHTHEWATFYLLPARAWELLLGSLLAMERGRFAASPGGLARETSGWLGILLIGGPIFFYDGNTRFPGLAAVPPCLGAALIIFSSESKPSLVGRILAFQPVVFIGLISYSLYLWHWPALVFSKYLAREEQSVGLRAGLLLASTVLAILSWKYVETPFRKRWILQRRSQIFGFAGLAMATLLMLGFRVDHGGGFPSRVPANALRYHASRNHGASQNEVSLEQAVSGEFFEIGSHDSSQPIKLLLWGDSHAISVAPVLDELACRFSWRGFQATHSATPPILGYADNDKFGLGQQTPAFANAVLAYVTQRHVQNVVIACSWSAYSKTGSLNAPLLKTVRALMDAGAKVYVLRDVPHPGGGVDVPRLAALTAMQNGDISSLGITPEKYQMAYREWNKAFDQISEMGATVLDPSGYFLNSQGLYGVMKHDEILFCDNHHLTVEGSRILTPLLEPIFRNE